MKWIAKGPRSLQIRLFLALVLIISIFIPGTGYFSYLQARNAVEKQMRHYAINIASQNAERIRQFLSQIMDNAHLIKAFFENGMIDINNPIELINYFYLLKREHAEFVNVQYGDRKGHFTMVPAQFPEIHKIFDPRIRPWYIGAVAAKGEHWTDVYIFASSQKPGITASLPIYKGNELQGVCGIDIDLSTFSRFLQSIKIENQGYAYIIENKNGRVIAHPDLIQRIWDPMHIELLSTCLADLKAAGKQFGATSFQGEYFYTAYTDYPENNWTVGVTLPMTEFLKHIQSIKNTTISLVVVAMVLCSIFSYLFTLTTVIPLKALRKGIERISRGDLDYHVDPPGLDIADALAFSFNQMAASLRKSKKELKRTYIELAEKEKMAALGQMTAGIAHELKNPLGVILGSAQVVANKERPWAMRAEAADFIIHEIERLNKTLKAFLDFSKPAQPCFSFADPIQLLEETLAATEAQLNDHGIAVQKVINAKKGLCSVDKDQIRQVLWNIILNAAQAMPEGGCLCVSAGYESIQSHNGNPGLSIISKNPAHQLIIVIADNGKGMTPDQIDKIFEPFVSYRSDGIGLGLSIVNQILKLHRAKIEVSSNLNRGTAFTLKFPCVENHEEENI
jgi:signal transduction histidine kinase